MSPGIDQLKKRRIAGYELGECIEVEGESAVYSARKVALSGTGLYSSLPIPGVSRSTGANLQALRASIRKRDCSPGRWAPADHAERWRAIRHPALPLVVDIVCQSVPDIGRVGLVAYQSSERAVEAEDVLSALLQIHAVGLNHGDLRRWLQQRMPIPPVPGATPWQDVKDLALATGHQAEPKARSPLHALGQLMLKIRGRQLSNESEKVLTGSITRRNGEARYACRVPQGHSLLALALPEGSIVSAGVMLPSEDVAAIGQLSSSSRDGSIALTPNVRCAVALECQGVITVVDVVLVGGERGVTRLKAWIAGSVLCAAWNWPTDSDVRAIQVVIDVAGMRLASDATTRRVVTFARHRQQPQFESRIGRVTEAVTVSLIDHRTNQVLAQTTAMCRPPSRVHTLSSDSGHLSESTR